MAITRRQFIKRTGLAAAGSFFGPGLFRNPLLSAALAATIGDRYFVVVFLDGGNDGLNTVTPIDNGATGTLRAAYEAARGTGGSGLRLTASELIPTALGVDPNTATPLAFHPALSGLKSLYDLGKVAVIQGCGYPQYNLSHDASTTIWETGDPLRTGFGTGWMGRYLAANYGGSDIPALNVRNEIAGEFIQNTTSVLAVRRLARFGFPYDEETSADSGARRNAFLALYNQAAAAAQTTAQYVGDSGGATLLSSESYPALHGLYTSQRSGWNTAYSDLNTGFARDLREVAKVINGVRQGAPNVHARFFEVRNGGYDTHSNQGDAGGQHANLHAEVGNALELFYQDCADMGVANQLCVLIWSEFSRRIQQNSNGTDHGSQGPMFVIGGTVNGGIYGNHPNVNESALDKNGNTPYSQMAGDPFRSTDFRDVYGTVLKHWLNMPEGQIASAILPADSGDPAKYWTLRNFDLGFL